MDINKQAHNVCYFQSSALQLQVALHNIGMILHSNAIPAHRIVVNA